MYDFYIIQLRRSKIIESAVTNRNKFCQKKVSKSREKKNPLSPENIQYPIQVYRSVQLWWDVIIEIVLSIRLAQLKAIQFDHTGHGVAILLGSQIINTFTTCYRYTFTHTRRLSVIIMLGILCIRVHAYITLLYVKIFFFFPSVNNFIIYSISIHSQEDCIEWKNAAVASLHWKKCVCLINNSKCRYHSEINSVQWNIYFYICVCLCVCVCVRKNFLKGWKRQFHKSYFNFAQESNSQNGVWSMFYTVAINIRWQFAFNEELCRDQFERCLRDVLHLLCNLLICLSDYKMPSLIIVKKI